MHGPGARQLGSGILTGSLAGASTSELARENVLMVILEVFLMVKLMTRGDQRFVDWVGPPPGPARRRCSWGPWGPIPRAKSVGRTSSGRGGSGVTPHLSGHPRVLELPVRIPRRSQALTVGSGHRYGVSGGSDEVWMAPEGRLDGEILRLFDVLLTVFDGHRLWEHRRPGGSPGWSCTLALLSGSLGTHLTGQVSRMNLW